MNEEECIRISKHFKVDVLKRSVLLINIHVAALIDIQSNQEKHISLIFMSS